MMKWLSGHKVQTLPIKAEQENDDFLQEPPPYYILLLSLFQKRILELHLITSYYSPLNHQFLVSQDNSLFIRFGLDLTG